MAKSYAIDVNPFPVSWTLFYTILFYFHVLFSFNFRISFHLARMFDFFDAGIMEGLQHRLRQISTLTNGCNSITFQGQCIMKRKTIAGITECFVQWSPREM